MGKWLQDKYPYEEMQVSGTIKKVRPKKNNITIDIEGNEYGEVLCSPKNGVRVKGLKEREQITIFGKVFRNSIDICIVDDFVIVDESN